MSTPYTRLFKNLVLKEMKVKIIVLYDLVWLVLSIQQRTAVEIGRDDPLFHSPPKLTHYYSLFLCLAPFIAVPLGYLSHIFSLDSILCKHPFPVLFYCSQIYTSLIFFFSFPLYLSLLRHPSVFSRICICN